MKNYLLGKKNEMRLFNPDPNQIDEFNYTK